MEEYTYEKQDKDTQNLWEKVKGKRGLNCIVST